MSTSFWKTLRTSPACLCAILGVTHAAFGSEAITAGYTGNQAVKNTDRTNSFFQQKIHTQKSVLPIQSPSVSAATTKIVNNAETSAVETANGKFTILSQKSQIKQQIQSSDISQGTDFYGLSTFQSNLLAPNYSIRASDFQINTTSPMSALNHQHLFNPTPNTISQTDTQQPNQPATPPPNKNQYNLFNPTPTELLRSFVPSRPSQTDSPYTVDAGHIQIETSLVSYSNNTNISGVNIDAYQILAPTIRVGLLNNVDFQLQLQTYNNVRTKARGFGSVEQSGYGDTIASVRVNLWGNDGGKTAFAVVPSIKFPTNQDNLGNDSIEGNIGFPLAIQLSDKWSVGLETLFAFNRDVADTGNNLGFVNSAVLSYQVNSKLGTYAEIYTNATTETGSDFVATFDTGVSYLLSSNFQIDGGLNVGLTSGPRTNNINPFVGFSVRF